ncbi:MAG: uroporphyrinogen-III synthase [Gammaproteobacteria bacterium]|nr:uroporphyrinogen-III synthase [Gammaproteobacteria bacterium]
MIHILNTRPTNTLGETAFHLPVIEITPVPFQSIKIDDFDYCVFLSANAVDCFFKQSSCKKTKTLFIAIGSATKDALSQLGFTHIITPSTFNSEGLLDLPEFQSTENKLIVIISGENPRPLLTEKLIQRGAQVNNVFCYARKPVSHDMDIIFPQLMKLNIDTVISASSESLFYLLRLFQNPEHRAWLLNKKLSVMSEKMKMEALAAGFCDVSETK